MTHRRCGSCRFWVTEQDRHCPNCGNYRPYRTQDDLQRFSWLGAVLGLVLFVALASPGLDLGALWGALLSMLAGIVVMQPFLALVLDFRDLFLRVKPSFQRYEAALRRRLRETDGALDRLDAVLARVRSGLPETEQARIAPPLVESREFYVRHRDGHRLKLFEIELARWINEVEPLSERLDRLSYHSCERRLETLEGLRARGQSMAEDWRLAGLDPVEGGPQAAARLHNALAAADELRQALIARQAQAVLEGVRPATVFSQSPSAVPALHERFEQFTARSEVGQFRLELDELEAQHQRLRSELDAVTQVQRALR